MTKAQEIKGSGLKWTVKNHKNSCNPLFSLLDSKGENLIGDGKLQINKGLRFSESRKWQRNFTF